MDDSITFDLYKVGRIFFLTTSRPTFRRPDISITSNLYKVRQLLGSFDLLIMLSSPMAGSTFNRRNPGFFLPLNLIYSWHGQLGGPISLDLVLLEFHFDGFKMGFDGFHRGWREVMSY